jgi:hypothetical protein
LIYNIFLLYNIEPKTSKAFPKIQNNKFSVSWF